MADLTILANRIADWCIREPDLDLLTFVTVDSKGNFVEEIRTYQQLWDNGQRLAAWLKAQGMRQGDRFALLMANHPEFVDLMVASSILGLVFVPIDPRTRGDKLRYMLDFAECKGVFVGDDALANLLAEWGDREDVWISTLGSSCGKYLAMAQILCGPLPQPQIAIASTDPESPMQMLYTSGTTGDPKAIISPHSRFGLAAEIAPLLGLTREDRPYTGLSLTHANAQVITLGSILSLGMRGVISRKFTKSRLWDITRYYGCTFFNLLGGMITAIYAEPSRPSDADNPVRRILCAGMPAVIWEDFAQRFGVELFEFYGAAEGGLTFNPPGVGPIGSCGKPPPSMELKIFAEDGSECAEGEAGEICFRNAGGSCPVVKYFKNPEASAKKTEGGWLRMGDIGHVDKNGWMFFSYRKGGGIRRNGDFINPAFVEKVLSEIDEVDDVFVYGVPADNGVPGEKDVVAAIVVNQQAVFDPSRVFAICRKKLEANTVPSYLQLVADIPKTASEKPQERFLRAEFSADTENVFFRKDGKCMNT